MAIGWKVTAYDSGVISAQNFIELQQQDKNIKVIQWAWRGVDYTAKQLPSGEFEITRDKPSRFKGLTHLFKQDSVSLMQQGFDKYMRNYRAFHSVR